MIETLSIVALGVVAAELVVAAILASVVGAALVRRHGRELKLEADLKEARLAGRAAQDDLEEFRVRNSGRFLALDDLTDTVEGSLQTLRRLRDERHVRFHKSDEGRAYRAEYEQVIVALDEAVEKSRT